jgi:hypothetical protein
MKRRIAAFASTLALMIPLACGDGADPAPDDVDGTHLPGDIVEQDTEDSPEDIVSDQISSPDGLEDAVIGPIQPPCTETVLNPIPVGSQVYYTCISVGEDAAYQHIRSVGQGAKAIKVSVEVAPPVRLGQSMGIANDALHYDTLTLDGSTVSSRDVYRLDAQDAPDHLLSFALTDLDPEEAAAIYLEPTRIMLFGAQPGGDRIALLLADLETLAGESHLHIFKNGTQDFVSKGIVSSFGWSEIGNQIAWVSGANLTLAGADGSGAQSADGSVMTTGIPPIYMDASTLVYASSKTALRKYTKGVGKEALDLTLPPGVIQAVIRIDEERVVVQVEETLVLVHVPDLSVTPLSTITSQGLRHPLALAPDGSSLLVGGSLDNPFKSFEYRLISIPEGGSLPTIHTEEGVGVVSTGIAWR